MLQHAIHVIGSDESADWLRRVNFHRLRFEWFSDRNPWRAPFAPAAGAVRICPRPASLSLAEFKNLARQQFLLIHRDEERALETLPDLVATSGLDGATVLDLLWQVISAGAEPVPAVSQRYRQRETLLAPGAGKSAAHRRLRPIA